MLILQTNDISEKQLAQLALAIQNRWDVPTFVKMHEVVISDDDLERPEAQKLDKDFENGLSIIFENLEITAAFRLKRSSKTKFLIERIPGSELPKWMEEIEGSARVPEGEYECPHCVLPETLILGDNKPIAEYAVGDTAIGLTGLNPVLDTFVRPYEGEVVKIKASGMLPITTTPEHPISSSKSQTINLHRNGKFRFQLLFSEESWIPAKDLVSKTCDTDGNYVVIPIIKGTFESYQVSLAPFIILHKPQHKGYRVNFPLTEDTAWLIGLYAAEGSATNRDVRFSLSKDEDEIKVRVAEIAKQLGYSTYAGYSSVANSMLVNIPSRVLARAFDTWCGHRAFNKRIPDFILCHQDLGILRGFLYGYETGDGYTYAKVSRRSKGYRSSSTISKILAQQLQLAYVRLGVWASVRVRDEAGESFIMGRRCQLHTKYSVSYPLNPNPKRQRVRFLKDKVLSPIRRITTENYSGKVYNLATSDNTYLISNALVHNCGRRYPTDIQLSMHQKLHYLV
ncbi:MAG: hypothetical protein OK457_10245 [Thaumarchaeota archaeon]|nr:hypothetical protein [Nitrososphaerota archaeon]